MRLRWKKMPWKVWLKSKMYHVSKLAQKMVKKWMMPSVHSWQILSTIQTLNQRSRSLEKTTDLLVDLVKVTIWRIKRKVSSQQFAPVSHLKMRECSLDINLYTTVSSIRIYEYIFLQVQHKLLAAFTFVTMVLPVSKLTTKTSRFLFSQKFCLVSNKML